MKGTEDGRFDWKKFNPTPPFRHLIVRIEWENPSGALPGRKVPRPAFMTRGDLPAIEDPSGREHFPGTSYLRALGACLDARGYTLR